MKDLRSTEDRETCDRLGYLDPNDRRVFTFSQVAAVVLAAALAFVVLDRAPSSDVESGGGER